MLCGFKFFTHIFIAPKNSNFQLSFPAFFKVKNVWTISLNCWQTSKANKWSVCKMVRHYSIIRCIYDTPFRLHNDILQFCFVDAQRESDNKLMNNSPLVSLKTNKFYMCPLDVGGRIETGNSSSFKSRSLIEGKFVCYCWFSNNETMFRCLITKSFPNSLS